MVLNSRQFKFLKNYRNLNVKSSAKREYRDENVFLKGDRALSKIITLLISNKKEFNHFFKSRRSDIVLLKVGNLHQNAKRYEARNTERVARDENVRAKRADFFNPLLRTAPQVFFKIGNYPVRRIELNGIKIFNSQEYLMFDKYKPKLKINKKLNCLFLLKVL